MSDPFSGIPNPERPRSTRRRFQPGLVEEALQAMRESVQAKLPVVERALRRAQRTAKEGLRRAQRHSKDLWYRGKRNPRSFGLIGAAITLTLVGAYAVSASMVGRSLCPPASEGKTPKFFVLMDSVPPVAAGSKVEIHYDVCGLAAGTDYRGRVRLTRQLAPRKKKSARPKPLVVSFKDQVDGVATRRHQQLSLASTRPGTYTLELSVTDKKGRERKTLQKVSVKAK